MNFGLLWYWEIRLYWISNLHSLLQYVGVLFQKESSYGLGKVTGIDPCLNLTSWYQLFQFVSSCWLFLYHCYDCSFCWSIFCSTTQYIYLFVDIILTHALLVSANFIWLVWFILSFSASYPGISFKSLWLGGLRNQFFCRYDLTRIQYIRQTQCPGEYNTYYKFKIKCNSRNRSNPRYLKKR